MSWYQYWAPSMRLTPNGRNVTSGFLGVAVKLVLRYQSTINTKLRLLALLIKKPQSFASYEL